MRSVLTRSGLVVALLCASACSGSAPPSSPRGGGVYGPPAQVEVQNNAAITVAVYCRRATGHTVRLGTLATGDIDRYEPPLNCGRVFARALGGAPVSGVLVRYLQPEGSELPTTRVVAASSSGAD